MTDPIIKLLIYILLSRGYGPRDKSDDALLDAAIAREEYAHYLEICDEG